MKSYSPKKSTDSLVGKYRKKVLGETPTLSAIWSVVVSSYPLVLNRFRAAFSRAFRIRSACSSRGDRSPRPICQPPRPYGVSRQYNDRGRRHIVDTRRSTDDTSNI